MIKKIINYVCELFTQPKNTTTSTTVEVNKPKRKKYDTTQLTRNHYDIIIAAYYAFLEYNTKFPKDKKTVKDLTHELNDYFKLNKSTSSYNIYWNNKVNREDLPE